MSQNPVPYGPFLGWLVRVTIVLFGPVLIFLGGVVAINEVRRAGETATAADSRLDSYSQRLARFQFENGLLVSFAVAVVGTVALILFTIGRLFGMLTTIFILALLKGGLDLMGLVTGRAFLRRSTALVGLLMLFAAFLIQVA